MRILAIRIKNLTSLNGELSIDFTAEPLVSAGIFAITGPTGSGKSTILDGLCLALYGKAPRFRGAESGIEVRDVGGSTISQGDVRGILRDGTAEGYAEVDFVGVDQQRYRARWSVRRARARADGNLQQAEISLTNLSTGSPVAGRRTELQPKIEELVGLNFEQFTRSVLLAQGDFKAFLEANKDQKASLLEKLTGQQVYSEISVRVFERNREENQVLQNLEVRRGEIRTLTTEELAEYGRERGELDTEVLGMEQVITQLSAGIAWYAELNLLQTGRDEAIGTHQLAVTALSDAEPRIHRLREVESVQAIRPSIIRRRELQEQIAEKTELFQQQEESLQGLRATQEGVGKALEEAGLILAESLEAMEGAQPGLNRAKALDEALMGKAEEIGRMEEELSTVLGRQEELNRSLGTKKREAVDLAGEINRLTGWKVANAECQEMAANENLIFSRLKDAAGLLEKLQKLELIGQQTEREREGLVKESGELNLQKEAGVKDWEKAYEEYNKKDGELRSISLEELEKEKLEVDAILLELSDGSGRWGLLWASKVELDRIQSRLDERGLTLGRMGDAFVVAVKELAAAGLKKETSRNILEKMELKASATAEGMRARLVEDEPCPVCGSTHHPYASGNQLFDETLEELKVEFRGIEQEYGDYLKEHGRLQQALDQLKGEIEALQEDWKEKEAASQMLENDWRECVIYEEAMQQPEAALTGWLQSRRSQASERQRLLQDQLRAGHLLRQQVEAGRELRDRLEKKLVIIQEGIKDNERSLVSVGERQTKQSEELTETKAALSGIEEQLKNYLPSEQWFVDWKADSKGVERRIGDAVAAWKTNVASLDENFGMQRTLAGEVAGLEGQLAGVDGDRKRHEAQLESLNSQNTELQSERAAWFGGRAASDVERGLKAAVETARAGLETQRKEKEELGISITRTTAEKEQNGQSITVLNKHFVEADGEIRDWLSGYNREQNAGLSEEDLVELLGATSDWRRSERAALQELNDAVIRTDSVRKERGDVLAAHMEQGRPEQEADELDSRLPQVRSDLDIKTRRIHEIDFQLLEDAEHKVRISALLQEIDVQRQVVENWARLNEVIGSADGKKFRTVAQEYTLDVLVRFSNVHLRRLSSRYVLERVPSTLGLQVVDLDMGNEVRAVISLSGGESFLVSLALALGLASLTSSRMRVESLFIDEGFGSLDPDTLNVAMDALERLHQQGRKVGVISHVQEMTERIPVQIRVSREGGGGSRVEIVGG